MVIGYIICAAAFFAFGWLAYQHFLKHAERRSDRKANDAWRFKKSMTDNNGRKISFQINDTNIN